MKNGFIFLMVCFLSFSFYPAFSQESRGEELQNVTDVFGTLEQNLKDIESELQTLSARNANLTELLTRQKQLLTEQTEASATLAAQLRRSEQDLKNCKITLKRWKVACGVTIAVTVPVIAVLIIYPRK